MNGDVLKVISAASHQRICFQGLVEDEIISRAAELVQLVQEKHVDIVSGEDLLASEIAAIVTQYNIGLGEAECILIGKKKQWRVASDDRKARLAATAEVGANQVTGSLGLLREVVGLGAISRSDAFDAYRQMRKLGGFLPAVEPTFFEAPAPNL
jgi:predicted nucleic acid-binding protein